MTTCKIKEEYDGNSWFYCERPSWGGDPEGLCILHSQLKDKDRYGAFTKEIKDKLSQEDYDFRGVYFPGLVEFVSYCFRKDANFYKATFSEEANFFYATFSTSVDFRFATFSKKALFSSVTFSTPVDFKVATFSGEADFSEAIFSGEAYFSLTRFSDRADFKKAKFLGETDFDAATFSGEALFLEATFSGEAIFIGVNPPQEKGGKRADFKGDFECLRLGRQALIRFEDLSLALVRFGGTDLRKARFFNVIWHRLRGRNIVYDEKFLKDEKNYNRVEELYRHLKLNYEREGDLKNAGDFHYGEMNMYRQADYLRRWFSWYFLYWASSGYGEKPVQAFSVLFGLLTILALLFGLADTNFIKGWSLNGITDSILYTLQQGTFQRPEWYKPANTWGKFLTAVSPILLPGQAALFILALRNRLGRRR